MNWHRFSRHSKSFNHLSATFFNTGDLLLLLPYSTAMWAIFESTSSHIFFYFLNPLSSSLPGFFILQVWVQMPPSLCCWLSRICHLRVTEQDLFCALLTLLWIEGATTSWHPWSQGREWGPSERSRSDLSSWDKCYFSLESSLMGLSYHFTTKKQRWWLRGKYQGTGCIGFSLK